MIFVHVVFMLLESCRWSLVDQDQHPRDDAEDSQKQVAVWYADAEQRHKVAENDPDAQQKDPFRAIHELSVGQSVAHRYAVGATSA